MFDKFDENEVKDTKNDALTTESDTNDDEEELTEEEKLDAMRQIAEEEQCQKISPFYQKYLSYQAQHPTAVVAYRLGDFYEVFGAYAVMIGGEIGLTITGRDVGLKERIPMVGFPYHAAENYFAKIVKYHDLYIIENDGEKQFIERIETAVNRHMDEDTGEILTEEEMREFDGDIEEPDDIFSDETTVPDVVEKLKNLLGDVFIVR